MIFVYCVQIIVILQFYSRRLGTSLQIDFSVRIMNCPRHKLKFFFFFLRYVSKIKVIFLWKQLNVLTLFHLYIPSIVMIAWAFVNLYFATAFLWRYNPTCNSLWDLHALLLNVGADSFISGHRNLDIIIIFPDFDILVRFEIFKAGCLRFLVICDGPSLGNLFNTLIRKVTPLSSRSKLLTKKVASYTETN